MALTTFDTHELVKDLKAAGFNDEQAEAVTRAVKNAREIDFSELATKADVKGEIASLRADIALLSAKLDNIAANYATKAELSDTRNDIIRWMLGLLFGQAALIIALLKLLPGPNP
ncbi:MAG TPA: coiled-coil domain-containing protein [Stellaceae bacterium]|nr:coiled-coil domain-containing protein [Stellaceae bacterium]